MTVLFWLFARIPLVVASALAWGAAWTWWLVLPVRRRGTVERFRAVFPEERPGPHLRRALHGLILGYVELLHELRRPTVTLTVENSGPLHERRARGEGTVVIAGHFGSWDLLGPMIGRETGLPATVIVKIPSLPAFAALVERMRRSFGLELISGRNVMPEVYDALSRGLVTVFLLDQRFKHGVPVPFFGRPAWTSVAAAVAAAKVGSPVWGLEYWREGIARHRARWVGPFPVTGDAERDTAAFQRFYEDAIRERPHNWLWLHDRWKVVEPGRDKAAGGAPAAGDEPAS